MRNFYLVLVALISSISFGQFNYQSIIKDSNGEVIKNNKNSTAEAYIVTNSSSSEVHEGVYSPLILDSDLDELWSQDYEYELFNSDSDESLLNLLK